LTDNSGLFHIVYNAYNAIREVVAQFHPSLRLKSSSESEAQVYVIVFDNDFGSHKSRSLDLEDCVAVSPYTRHADNNINVHHVLNGLIIQGL
jgi:hypothetical protein